jgi:hypothetical protein
VHPGRQDDYDRQEAEKQLVVKSSPCWRRAFALLGWRNIFALVHWSYVFKKDACSPGRLLGQVDLFGPK